MCKHEYVFTSWCKTCKLCGLESSFLSLDKYNVYSAPLERGYNRTQRFRIKIDKLLCLHNGPNCLDPIWKYLDGQKLFMNTPFDVRQTIRRSKLKLKHYDSVRIFSDAFTTFRISLHEPLALKKHLLRRFDKLYHRWVLANDPSFFSYDWILRHFLEAMNSPLVVYLKPQTCRKRDQKYRTKLHDFEKMMELGVMTSQDPIFGMGNVV